MTVSRRVRLAGLLAGIMLLLLSTSVNASGSLTRVLTTSAPNLPESIAIDHQGNFFLSFPFAGAVVKVRSGGAMSTIATFPGMNPLGVRLDEDGNAFIAVPGSGIWEVPAGGGIKVQRASGSGLWNGIAFDEEGNLFVSDSHGGAIWRLTTDGTFSEWSASPLLRGTTAPGPCGLVHPAVPSFGVLGANGVEFNSHGDLLVNNTDLGTVVRIAVNDDGSAGAAAVIAGPSCDLWGADGIAVDSHDNAYVAANSRGQIDRVSPGGAVEVLAAGSPLNFPSDIAFGTRPGDRTQIYITNFAAFATSNGGPGLLKMNVGIPGKPLGD